MRPQPPVLGRTVLRRVWGVSVAAFALTSGALAQAPSTPTPPTSRIEIESLSGEVRPFGRDGALTSLTAEGAAFARLGARTANPLPAALDPAALAEVALAGGDRVRGLVATAGADRLAIDLGGAALPIAVDALRSVVFEARIPRAATAAPTASADADVLYLVAGQGLDRAEGLLEEFSAEGVVFEDGRAGRRTYPWARIAALFIVAEDSEAAASEPTEAERALDPVVVGLSGGGRLSGRLRSFDTVHVVLARPGGVELAVPADLVLDVALADGSFVFLSDLPVADGGPVSLFGDDLGFTWPHRIDRAVDGGPLTVAGKVEARGLGVHAPSRLTWRLDGAPRRLRFGAGVDDSGLGTERNGSVRFRVLGDGRELWASALVRAGQPALAPPALDLGGVRELVLEVDPEGDFVLDRANWLRPLLVRGEG